jgi:hypothetical protein
LFDRTEKIKKKKEKRRVFSLRHRSKRTFSLVTRRRRKKMSSGLGTIQYTHTHTGMHALVILFVYLPDCHLSSVRHSREGEQEEKTRRKNAREGSVSSR